VQGKLCIEGSALDKFFRDSCRDVILIFSLGRAGGITCAICFNRH
jgi:hypothetical protein